MTTTNGSCSMLLSTIREVITQNPFSETIQFVCETLLNFERFFGSKNKEAMRKVINEAVANFGPATDFRNDENMIPIYVLHGRYSRSMTVSEVFDKLYDKCCYRKSALFYSEWAKAYMEDDVFERAEVVIEEGFKRGARPVHILDETKRSIRVTKKKIAAISRPPDIKSSAVRPLNPLVKKTVGEVRGAKVNQARQPISTGRSPNCLSQLTGKIKLQNTQSQNRPSPSRLTKNLPILPKSSARKALFMSSEPSSSSCSANDILRSSEIVLPGPAHCAPMLSIMPELSPVLPPTEFYAPTPSPVYESVLPVLPVELSDDSENCNPDPHSTEPPRRRPTGILVPAVGFQIEDYDFYNKEDEDLKSKANLENIRNNTELEEDVNIVTPLLPALEDAVDNTVEEELFVSGEEFFKSFVPLEERDRNTLTAFELKQMNKRLSTARMTLTFQKHLSTIEDPTQKMMEDLARLGLNSPGPSTSQQQ